LSEDLRLNARSFYKFDSIIIRQEITSPKQETTTIHNGMGQIAIQNTI